MPAAGEFFCCKKAQKPQQCLVLLPSEVLQTMGCSRGAASPLWGCVIKSHFRDTSLVRTQAASPLPSSLALGVEYPWVCVVVLSAPGSSGAGTCQSPPASEPLPKGQDCVLEKHCSFFFLVLGAVWGF